MKYKLLAVDIDGTLLNSKGILTKKTKDSIYKAIDKGVIFVICTGRPIQGVTSLNDELGIDLPYITYNGAMVVKGKSKEILYERSLQFNSALSIYELGKKYDTTIIIWSNNKLYVNRADEKAKEYSELTNTPYTVVKMLEDIPHEITKILWYDDNAKLLEYQKNISPNFRDKVNFHLSRPYFLEFVDVHATKAIAIQKLCKYYNIDISETIAIGDGYNDLSMISTAGLGVAMENAPEEIKNAAKFITTSCDEDGVANVISKFILEVS
ncbi:Cof-type HAD-IIB family hydrolase [Alkalibaculum sp. M08DMB]|uniref:Cof-type HAD-IIB family hydrolase n=1 Tax=Alkalibaculum sporogenes TaxID=2655001 RepID=A0A6A7KAY4_9FIRM|nr:Cof-type HAD-IIB family hydrolase [Alkalibaculum sporogenes]MPW26564.1 Cof-type HAD-IIB family hydrolase [Alkalibaculum sporogenes]